MTKAIENKKQEILNTYDIECNKSSISALETRTKYEQNQYNKTNAQDIEKYDMKQNIEDSSIPNKKPKNLSK